jgi:hypothetical protein
MRRVRSSRVEEKGVGEEVSWVRSTTQALRNNRKALWVNGLLRGKMKHYIGIGIGIGIEP